MAMLYKRTDGRGYDVADDGVVVNDEPLTLPEARKIAMELNAADAPDLPWDAPVRDPRDPR